MPKYRITDPESGVQIELEGDSPPTEQELVQIFSNLPASETAPAPVTPQAPEDEDDDSFFEDILDVGAEFARGGNKAVADTLDFVTSPARASWNAWNDVLGTDAKMPTFNDMLQALPGGTSKFMQEGTAKDVTAALGYTFPIAGAFMPVQRASGATSSVVQDILGFGSSTPTVNEKLAEKTIQALKTLDQVQLGKETLSHPDDIYEAARNLGEKQLIEKNRPLFDKAERTVKQQKKDAKAGLDIQRRPPDFDKSLQIEKLEEDMYTLYGVNPDEVREVIKSKGGLQYEDTGLIKADKLFKQDNIKTGDVGTYDKLLLPTSDLLRKYVGTAVGGRFERAFETATRNVSNITEKLGKPIEKVIKAVDDDVALKRMFLEVGEDPALMPQIKDRIQSLAGEDGLQEFNKFLAISLGKQGVARRKIYKAGQGFDDDFFFHTQRKVRKGVTKPNSGVGMQLFKGMTSDTPPSLKNRTRVAEGLTDELVGMYENPLATHLKYIADQEILLELSEKFGLRPSISKGGNVKDFFKEIRKRLERDGFKKERAKLASDVMYEAYKGSRSSPPAAVRAFMSLSYAGTLAQLKTALLNIHDVAVAMYNQGTVPTLRAIFQSNKSQFGKTLKQLGMGESQSVGEFVANFDKYQANPSMMDKIARQSRNVSDVSMFVSGFKAMDGIGKGIVLRATLNNARKAAQQGKLVKNYGHLMDIAELQRIRPYLRNKTLAKDMPKGVSDLIEQLVFSGLGEQQLISAAGRPLGYLKTPIARPLYALTGFAIKQQALLRRDVVENLYKGNYAKAGERLASYMAFAGIGYGVIHESREAIAGKEEFNEEDIWINAVDQIAAAATLNKLGDDYGRDAFRNDPVGFILESFVPPTGLVGAVSQDAYKMIFEGEYSDKVVEKIPLLGDFYKYYWKD